MTALHRALKKIIRANMQGTGCRLSVGDVKALVPYVPAELIHEAHAEPTKTAKEYRSVSARKEQR
jgi:hypothetical protein